METPKKTIVFGLDGFDIAYARRLAQAGHLPWLESRLKNCSIITTDCPEFPGSEWVNAACGVNPAHHGYLHTQQLRVGSYEIVETDANVVRTDPFYVPLARRGKKTLVLDLCVDRPRPMDNLIQVIDWATEFKLYHYCTTPRSIRKSIDRTCPDHPLTNYGVTDPSESNLIQLKQKLTYGTALKGKLVRQLMDTNPDWSVLFAGFCEIHKAGHFFWQYQDPSHPNFAGNDHVLEPALRELYQLLDQQMMEICESAGPETNFVIVADRGMRPNYSGDHMVQAVLTRLGLLRLKNPAPADTSDMQSGTSTESSQPSWGPPPLVHRLKKRIPVALRPAVRRLLGKEVIDWHDTKVFQVPDVGNSYLRVNLKGREPDGATSQAEYAALLNLLEREFMSLVNPATGRCPVREVSFPHETFTGPLREHLPDFSVVWEDDSPITTLESPTIGRIRHAHVEQRSGNHTEKGGMLVSGPDFSAGTERQGDLRELAPTLLSLYDVPAPKSYEFPAMQELKRTR